MIARIWRGTTDAARADEYLDYIRKTGLSDYASTPGFRDVQVLRRTREGLTRFTIISYWDSLEAIKAFAGDDPEAAHYYPEDDEYLVERELAVEHHDVVETGPPLAS